LFLDFVSHAQYRLACTNDGAAIAGAKRPAGQCLARDQGLREKLLEGIVATIDKVYILIIAGGAITFICSMLLKRERLFLATGGGGGA